MTTETGEEKSLPFWCLPLPNLRFCHGIEVNSLGLLLLDEGNEIGR